jgi:SAM-dependent methyltransferase
VAWDQIGSSYDRVADKYEARFVDELDGKPRDRELLLAFAGAVEDPVADLGCGPGQIGAFVRSRGRRVLGVDLSPRMAQLASRRLTGAAAGDLRALPLSDGSAGGLLAFYCLIHLPRADVHRAFAEFRRVLRPGGRVLLAAQEGTDDIEREEYLDEPVPMIARFFELEDLKAGAHAAGLEVVHAERRAPYEAEHAFRLYVEARRPT